MSEENPIPNAIDDYSHNKLKDVDVTTIETTIAKALSELVGVEYKCSIDEISYGERISKGGKFNVNIWEKSDLTDLLGGFGQNSAFGKLDFSTRIESLGERSRMIVDVLLSENRWFTSEEVSNHTKLNKYLVANILSELYKDGLVSIDRSTGDAFYKIKSQ